MKQIYQEKLNEMLKEAIGSNKIFQPMSVKNIKLYPEFSLKMSNEWTGKAINVKVRKAILDGETMWYVMRNRKALVYMRKPTSEDKVLPQHFNSDIFQAYGRMIRHHDRLKTQKNSLSDMRDYAAKVRKLQADLKKARASHNKMQIMLISYELEALLKDRQKALLKKLKK